MNEGKQKIKSGQWRAIYYYVRDEEKKPIVSVCLIEDGRNILSRGISVCSLRDLPNKAKGRGLALSRALFAIENECCCEPINRFEAVVIPETIDFGCKVDYNPILTEHEEKLLAKLHGEGRVE